MKVALKNFLDGRLTDLKRFFGWGEPRDFFLIVGHPRSGTTFLETLLADHPDVVCLHEPFRPNANAHSFKYFFSKSKANRLLKIRKYDLLAYAEKIYSNRSRQRAFGLKLLFDQPLTEWFGSQRLELWKYLSNLVGLKVILVDRNPLYSACSLELAQKDKVFQVSSKQERSKKLTVEDIPNIKNWLHLMIKTKEEVWPFLNEAELLELSYEQLLQDQKPTLATVQTFLGLSNYELQSKLVKQNPTQLYDLFDSPDQARVALKKEFSAQYLPNYQ
jgi:LPS sulfotransferase NodH